MLTESNNQGMSVALCTYNGAEYIIAQLKSITIQSLVPSEIVVCDDASTDRTVELVRQYAEKSACPIRLYENKSKLGVQANFDQAIGLCRQPYIALSDQDDLWKPQKLERLKQAITKAEDHYGIDTPILVYSDLEVIDDQNKPISQSYMKQRKLNNLSGITFVTPSTGSLLSSRSSKRKEPYLCFGEEQANFRGGEDKKDTAKGKHKCLAGLLAQNYITGSTILINKYLANNVLPMPEGIVMHDWWVALVAAATGEIIYVDEQLVKYRQHHTNLIGANSFFSAANIWRMLNVKEFEKHVAAVVRQEAILKKHLEELLSKNSIKPPVTLDNVLTMLGDHLNALGQGRMKAVRGSFYWKVGMQGFTRNIFYRTLLYKSGYLGY